MNSSLKHEVFTRDAWKCRHCGFRNALQAHHLIYKSHQGADLIDNLISLCNSCHRGHHDGKLQIDWGELGGNGEVKFTRKAGWKPQ